MDYLQSSLPKTPLYICKFLTLKHCYLAGLRFIELNFAFATDQDQYSPIGFDVIFPRMLQHAEDLSLKLHLESRVLSELLHKRDIELRRYILDYFYMS